MVSRSYTYPNRTTSASSSKKHLPPSNASAAYMAQVLGINRVKNSSPSLPTKRKASAISTSQPDPEIGYDSNPDLNDWEYQQTLAGNSPKPERARKRKGEEAEEKRLKRFRTKPPVSYNERLERVRTQRMFLINRKRGPSSTGDGTEEEVFDLAGTTGNVYQVTVGKVPRCSCPDNGKGNQCKHIIYILVNVLKAREDLAYQLAFVSTELEEIFANAPITPQASGEAAMSTDTGGSRKPVEGDCPVCVMEFEDGEEIVWCKAACGNNIHKNCFEQWARSKAGIPKCVYCRTPWKQDGGDMKNLSSQGTINSDGYVNIASQLGISGHRDTSTYHQYWVRREYGY